MDGELNYRQVHLDFHTSEHVPEIGTSFDKGHWQKTLLDARVNSVTCFALCHHGWSYYDTKIGKRHPGLDFDLLRAQFDACKEVGINVPIYLTAGLHNVAAADHPEWREIGPDGRYIGRAKDVFSSGFKTLCFNSPYVDYLAEQVREVVSLFPDADGIFLDIIEQGDCHCKWCRDLMRREGLDLSSEADRRKCAELALKNYYQKTTAAARSGRKDMPVFHNSGHIPRGKRDIFDYFSHFELESLPTGGWGYDHFPISSKYCHAAGVDFLGMTGKFHTTWGEFGGYKHPNALRYECAAMVAMGSKCSIGDQLHPSGRLDESTYKLVGGAYADVERLEPWCRGAKSVADIGLLSSEAVNGKKFGEYDNPADTGAARILLEGHFLFDVIDAEMDFSSYRLLILPDDLKVGPDLKTKLDGYIAGGGKLFLSGTSGLGENGFLFDVGAEWLGVREFEPDYVLPENTFRPDFCDSPFVMYSRSQKIRPGAGQSLGDLYDPYFNRTGEHFCSHQHAPPRVDPSGDACGILYGNIAYLAHPVFSIYRATGAVACKAYVIKVLRSLLNADCTLQTSLPSAARVVLMHQPAEQRYILHLLYGSPAFRGGTLSLPDGLGTLNGVEVIEEFIPLHDIEIKLKVDRPVRSVRSVPDGAAFEFRQSGAQLDFTVPEFAGHKSLCIEYQDS